MRDYSQAFFWLSDAKIINCCYNSTEPSIGLKLNEERTTLKCYMGDTGLLISHAFDERGIVSADLYRKLMFDKLEVNEGMLACGEHCGANAPDGRTQTLLFQQQFPDISR